MIEHDHAECHTVAATAQVAREGLVTFVICRTHQLVISERGGNRPEPAESGSNHHTRSVTP